MILETVAQRRELLDRSHTVAMVGASANPNRPKISISSLPTWKLPILSVVRKLVPAKLASYPNARSSSVEWPMLS